MENCNICGGSSFVPGPEGRMSRDGLAPSCSACGSRERDRRARALTDMLFAQISCSTDSYFCWGDQRSIARERFKSVRAAKRPSEGEALLAALAGKSATFISCLNVLQSVLSPRDVVIGIARALSADGLAILAYANPYARTRTVEFSGVIESNLPRRVFGRDFESVYGEAAPELLVFRTEVHDPVTRDGDFIYVATKNPLWLKEMFNLRLEVRLLD